MAFGNPESLPSGGDDKEKKEDTGQETPEVSAESVSVEKESIGRNQEKYKDPNDHISHSTTALRDQLDSETLGKLEKMKKRQQTKAENEPEDLDEAA